MSTLEIIAAALTVACVILAVKRKVLQYPVGILSTAAYFVVFMNAHLYASTALQVFFLGVQLYGWWFWLRGDRGKPPRITSWPRYRVFALCLAVVAFAGVLSIALDRLTDAKVAFLDASLFALSATAQFLLDRKAIETWFVWAAVDVLSVAVYGSQELWATTALYIALTLNTIWGYVEWRRELASYSGNRT